MSSSPIDRFLVRVRRRLNLRTTIRSLILVLLTASVVMLAVAAFYIVQGYAVDRRWYLVVAGLSLISLPILWLARRAGSKPAAKYADHFFNLQDSLVSWLNFTNKDKTGGFYELHAEQTEARVQTLDPQHIDWRPNRGITVLAVLLAFAAVGLAWKKPSEAVASRIAMEERTLAQTAQINEQLDDLIEELDQQAKDDLERELLEPDKLHDLIEQLKATRDQKEALRQYARLEQQLNEARTRLQQRRDEHLLNEASKELEKSRDTKSLSEKLSQKKYKEASEELKQAAPDVKRELTEQQKELAKLRAASQRMAAAAKASAAGTSANGSGEASEGTDSTSGGGELANAMQELDEALSQWDESLTEAARQEKANGECDSKCLGQCSASQENANKKLGALSKYLSRMQVKRDALEKLSKLCQACSQCQGGLCKSNGPKPGGKYAGMGTSTARRNEQDPLNDNGQTESLQGIKGDGPSLKTVEAAEDGSGTASQVGAAKVRSYQRQYESFVSREDVPEEVKTGVKSYFQAIHQIEEAP
ncbi:MAG: hypothetical protein RJP95_04290 [Pirellulales bacterium]